jgi:chromosome condensin MukBEF MukE localization factor
MRRLFWLAMGVTVGVLVVRKLQRAADRLTPRSMAGSLGEAMVDLGDSIRRFGSDVRAAASEREAELRAGTGMDGSLGRTGGEVEGTA